MKSIIKIFFCLVLLSCNNSAEKKQNTSASSTEDKAATSNQKEAGKNGSLKQNADYSSLFGRDYKDCDFIDIEGIAKAIDVPISTIEKGTRECDYHVIDSNGNKTTFYFKVNPWPNKTVLKEIETAKDNAETFGENSKLSQYRISETGDTYLSMHQNRMIRILNEKNENAITVLYSIESSATETNNLKDVARERSYAIANYILNTHKK